MTQKAQTAEERMKGLIIGLDFDGTVVTHDYPRIGKPLPNCIVTLKKAQFNGAKICLNTMRCGKYLDEAVEYLKANGIELYGINCNPEQSEWTNSPKVYAHLYIDDAALGAPVIADEAFSHRPHLDWLKVEEMLFSGQSSQLSGEIKELREENQRLAESYGKLTARLASLVYRITKTLEDKDTQLKENGYDLQNPLRQGFMLAEELVKKEIDGNPIASKAINQKKEI